MAVTATAIGTAHTSGNTNHADVVTTVAVPSGSVVVVAAMWTDNVGVTPVGVTGGSLTFAQDLYQAQSGLDAAQGVAFYSAPAPSGLSSGVTLSLTFNQSLTWGCEIHAFYLQGADTSSSRFDAGAAAFTGASPGTAWSAGPVTTTNANDGLLAAIWSDGASGAQNTPSTGWTELTDDYDPVNSWEMAVQFKAVSSAGSQSGGGTLGNNPNYGTIKAIVAYKAASSSGPQTVSVAGKGSAAAYGAATPRPGGVARAVSGKTSAAAFGAVGVHTTITTAIPGRGSAAAFGAVTPAPGNVNVTVTGKGTAASFGGLTLDIAFFIAGLGSAAAFGAVNASTTGGAQNVLVSGKGSAAAFSSVVPAPGNINVAVTGRGSAAAFGSAVRVNQRRPIPGCNSAAVFGALTTAVGPVTVSIAGLGSAAQFGAVGTAGGIAPTFNPAVQGGDHRHRR